MRLDFHGNRIDVNLKSLKYFQLNIHCNNQEAGPGARPLFLLNAFLKCTIRTLNKTWLIRI